MHGFGGDTGRIDVRDAAVIRLTVASPSASGTRDRGLNISL
jgi:hypothetical protein